MIDRFLRNNLSDDDYAEYSAALDVISAPQPPVPFPNYGECDECGEPYSYDPRDKGSICVTCMMRKQEALQAKVAEQAAEIERLTGDVAIFQGDYVKECELNIKHETTIAQQAALIEKCEKGLATVESLIDESKGVTGLHLNGDVALWTELREGGNNEGWLIEFDEALAAPTIPEGMVMVDKKLLSTTIKLTKEASETEFNRQPLSDELYGVSLMLAAAQGERNAH